MTASKAQTSLASHTDCLHEAWQGYEHCCRAAAHLACISNENQISKDSGKKYLTGDLMLKCLAHMFGYMALARSILALNDASLESRIYIGRLVGPGPDWENGCQIDMEKDTGSLLVAK